MPEKMSLPFVGIGLFYFICVGSIYEWGYWSVFNVNFFEYLSSVDFLKSAITPILNTFIFVLLGAIFGFLTSIHSKREVPIVFSRTWWWEEGWVYLCALIVLFSAVLGAKHQRWMGGTIFVLFIIGHVFIYNAAARRFAEKTYRLPFYIIMLPILSFGIGKSAAYKTYENIEYIYLKKDELPKKITANEDLKYLGKISDYIFLMSLENDSLFIIEEQDIMPLILHQKISKAMLTPKNQ